MQAFERGGGGAAAESSRAGAKSLAKNKGEKSTEASTPAVGGKDPRLQPPARQEKNPTFKPGASTWNTDDPSQVHPRPQNDSENIEPSFKDSCPHFKQAHQLLNACNITAKVY